MIVLLLEKFKDEKKSNFQESDASRCIYIGSLSALCAKGNILKGKEVHLFLFFFFLFMSADNSFVQ